MIDLMPDQDQEESVRWARELLEQELPDTDVLTGDVASFPVARLARRLGELGWFAFTLPEAQGGAGLRYADEVLMIRELGRRVAPGPLIPTMLAARLAAQAGLADLTAGLVAGTSLAGLAEVQGDRVVVLDAGPVDHLLVVDPVRVRLTLVPFPGEGPEFVASIDPYHRFGELSAADLPEPLADAGELAAELLAHLRVLTAAFLTGLAERARDDSAEYAKIRVQYGKPIGTYQAVKHRCADNALRAEAAWAQTAVAAVRLGDVGAEAAELDVAAAKMIAGDAAVRNARDNIQNHGGMGYTFENEAHLYLKRAHVLVNLLGDARAFTGLMLDGVPSW